MKFKELGLSDQHLFERFLSLDEHELSTYQFCNIFIWRKLFKIFYIILDDYLCLFFKDSQTCFMYLPPLGRRPDSAVIKNCFAIMDEFNLNKQVSRIENVEAGYLWFYQKSGYAYYAKPGDYLCKRSDIADLKGNRFKSQRACYNYFIKHYEFEFRPYLLKDIDACLGLYEQWAEARKRKYSLAFYQQMLKDNFLCQAVAMKNFFRLGLIGYVIEIKGKIAGYTFGFSINPGMFCILSEICDLAYRGISQFIFSQFCQRLSGYEYINIMDDSGLENLRKVKLSYHPLRIVPNYIIKRKDYA